MADVNAKFLGTIPEYYDRHLGPTLFEPYAADLARRVTDVGPGPVLEVACGTGILTARLHASLPSTVPLVATDLNPPMIDYARLRLGAAQRIDWRPADAASLPFESAAFAAMVCQFGVMFVPDKAAMLREARRVLVKDGLLAFNVWGSLEDNPFGRIAHETIGRFFASNPPTFYRVPFGFHDAEFWRSSLEGSDFGRITCDWVDLEARSATARSFAIGLVKGNPIGTAIQERGLSAEPIVDAVEAALAEVGGRQPFVSTMRALVMTARAGVN